MCDVRGGMCDVCHVACGVRWPAISSQGSLTHGVSYDITATSHMAYSAGWSGGRERGMC